MSVKEYRELISLTRQYLSETFQNKECIDEKAPEFIVSELGIYNYFKEYAIRNKNLQAKPKTPVIQEIKPTPIVQNRYEPPIAPIKQVVLPEQKIEVVETPVVNTVKPLEPVAEIPKPEVEQKKAFELEPIKTPTPSDLSDVRKIVQELFPNQVFLDHLPQNAIQIIIISDFSEKYIINFLSNYSKAIDLLLGSSKIMTFKKFQSTAQSPDLKMIIQTADTVINHDGVAILQLSDLTKYFKEPALKAELWKMTTSKFLNG